MRLFWARGHDQAPVKLLCKAMNMPRSRLYHLFEDKEAFSSLRLHTMRRDACGR